MCTVDASVALSCVEVFRCEVTVHFWRKNNHSLIALSSFSVHRYTSHVIFLLHSAHAE